MKRRILIFMIACFYVLLFYRSQSASSAPAAPQSITILLLGTQSTKDDGRSADAVVVAVLQLNTGAVRLATIRRNVLVNDAESNALKLYAVAKDGPQAVTNSINKLFGQSIENYVMVDLAGMEKIIDTMDGITLEIGDKEWLVTLPDGTEGFHPAGSQTLSGVQALAYMKAPAENKEQQYGSHVSRVLSALSEKALKMDMNALVDLISNLLPYVETNMTLMQVLQAAGDALSVPVSDIKTGSFPIHAQDEVNGKETAVRILDATAEVEALYSFLYGP